MLCAGIPAAPICFLSHSDIVWACSSFRAVSGLLPAVTAVEGAGISRFSQLNLCRCNGAVTATS